MPMSEPLRPGLVTYRAACGLRRVFTSEEIVALRKEGDEQWRGDKDPTTLTILMGWKGDDKAESEKLHADQSTPELCNGCPYLCRRFEHVWPRDGVDSMAAVLFLECHTYVRVEENVPHA